MKLTEDLRLTLMLVVMLGTTLAARADYAADIQTGLRRLVRQLPSTVQVAEVVADRLAAGGQLWLAGDRGFVLEGLGRAGGLMTIKQLAKPEDLKTGEVVLLGVLLRPTEQDEALIARAREIGALVVGFGPAAAQTAGCLWLPVPGRTADQQGLPTITPLLVAELWTFTAEVVTALNRRGKMPPMYQSVLVPGGRERNAEHLGKPWEPEAPPALPPLVLGRTYLARLANCLRTFTRTQSAALAQAAAMATATKQAGHTVWFARLAHLLPSLPGQPGDPGLFEHLQMNTPEKLTDFVKPGDLILYLGYYEPYGPWVEKAHAAGARIVTIVSGAPNRPATQMGADLNLSGCWPFGDATVTLPGYDIEILPPSGFMQVVQYFMLNEAIQAGGQ